MNLQSGVTTAQFANLNFQGGTVVLNSTLTNSGTLTLAGSSGFLRLGGSGRINGGTVATSGGVALSSTGGTLDGVTLATDMTVENNGTLTVLNGLTLSGDRRVSLTSNAAGYSYLYVNGTGTQTIGGSGSIEFAGTGTQHYITSSGTPTLAIGSGITLNANAGGAIWNSSLPWTLDGTLNVNASGAGQHQWRSRVALAV